MENETEQQEAEQQDEEETPETTPPAPWVHRLSQARYWALGLGFVIMMASVPLKRAGAPDAMPVYWAGLGCLAISLLLRAAVALASRGAAEKQQWTVLAISLGMVGAVAWYTISINRSAAEPTALDTHITRVDGTCYTYDIDGHNVSLSRWVETGLERIEPGHPTYSLRFFARTSEATARRIFESDAASEAASFTAGCGKIGDEGYQVFRTYFKAAILASSTTADDTAGDPSVPVQEQGPWRRQFIEEMKSYDLDVSADSLGIYPIDVISSDHPR